MKLCSFQEFQLHHTDVSNCVPALRLWQQAFFVLRLRVLPRQLGALQTPRSAYRRQRANLLHTKTAGSFDLKQARASDTNLPHWCWRAGEWGEIVYNQQWAVSKYGAVISCVSQSGWHESHPEPPGSSYHRRWCQTSECGCCCWGNRARLRRRGCPQSWSSSRSDGGRALGPDAGGSCPDPADKISWNQILIAIHIRFTFLDFDFTTDHKRFGARSW